MVKNIIITIYILLIGIVISVVLLSANRNEQGIIQLGNTALVEIKNEVLKPKIVSGDLVLVNTAETSPKENDIISYFTLENGNSIINTNKIVGIVTDVNNEKIYSLKNIDGTIENIDNSCIIGKLKLTIPYVGTILNYIMSPEGFRTVTLLPASILFIIMLLNFIYKLDKKNK